jgi:hypothetical protein
MSVMHCFCGLMSQCVNIMCVVEFSMVGIRLIGTYSFGGSWSE